MHTTKTSLILIRAAGAFTALAFFLGGCSTAPLTIKKDASQVAARLGVPESELVFVSEGDVALAEEFSGFFNSSDAAVIALTEETLYWLHEDNALDEGVQRIPVAQVQSLSRDLDSFQVKTATEIHLVRLRGWDWSHSNARSMAGFSERLLEANRSVSITDAELIYQKPTNSRSLDPFNADAKSSPEAVITDINYESPNRFSSKYPDGHP